MNKIFKIFAALTLVCFNIYTLSAQLEDVEYQIQYNEDECNYSCYIKATKGSATSTLDRIQASHQYTIVTPSYCTLSVGAKYNPKQLSGTPANWSISTTALAPDIDTTHNYYIISTNISPVLYYDPISEGDFIKLFDIEVDNQANGMNGVRLYKNGIDLNAEDGLGGDFSNGMTIGVGNDQLYVGNLDQVYPADFGELAGPSNVYENFTTQLSPATAGWTSSDPSIADVDNSGEVTAYEAGVVLITYVNSDGCQSNIQLRVSPLADYKNVGIGTTDPHPSAMLDIVSAEKGLLIPRMSQLERLSITSPAEGLMVYQNMGAKGFYYWNGNEWMFLSNTPAANNFSSGQDQPAASLRATATNSINTIQAKQKELQEKIEKQTTEIEALLKSLR